MDLMTKALISSAAYQEDRDFISETMETLLPGGEIRFLYVKKTDTEAHIYRYGDNCVIAFAGTEGFKDFLYDAFFIPGCYKKGFVHSGFLSIIEQIKGEMNALIKELFPIGLINHMDIMGHSLGASLSILAVDEVEAITLTDEVTAFAPPNGFSRGAREYLENQYKIHTIVNNMDPITMAMGITSGRPSTKRTNLKGPWGHSLSKYIEGIKKYEETLV